MAQWRLSDELEELDPQSIGVAKANRGGADPNINRLQNGILKSFDEHGYDPRRHLPPIVIRYTSEAGKAELVAHNLRFTEGRVGLPVVHADRMFHGSLAGSHFSLAVRCVDERQVSPITGKDLGRVGDNDEKRKN